MTTVKRKIGFAATAVLASTLMLAGCAPTPIFDSPSAQNSQESTPSTAGGQASTPAESPTTAPPKTETPTQEESCDWKSPRMDSGSAKAPSGQSGDLAVALIGAWQHTHTDEGAGYVALKPTTDIRFVFPSSTRMLYCQDVKGATTQAENPVDLIINGMELELGSSGVSYGVVAWDANTMVWKNNRDGSNYLLQRR